MPLDDSTAEKLKETGLRYMTDASPGLMRQRAGKGFSYYDKDGKKITDEKILDRIEKLVIPPAWENVWISPSPNSHIQVTGFDDKGRKQYIYHPDWTAACQQSKFDQLETFAEALPKIRRRIRDDLKGKPSDKRTVIATVVWLLEHTFIRVGNDEYVKENGSFGLTTLRKKHLDLAGRRLRFEFKGKSGVAHEVEVTHPKIKKLIKKIIDLPGYEVFQYLDGEGEKHTIDSGDVNDYLKEITGEDITAKDFRTWGATLLCAEILKDCDPCKNEKDFNKVVRSAVKEVSSHLRNTPTVCRSYYIHPLILDCFKNQTLQNYFRKTQRKSDMGYAELAVKKLIALK